MTEPTANELAAYTVAKYSTSGNPLVDSLLAQILAEKYRELGYE